MRLGQMFSEVGAGLRRNLSMVVSVILVTFISLTFVGTAVLLQMQISAMKGYWYDRAQVVVYMCNETSIAANCVSGPASETDLNALEREINGGIIAPYVEGFEHQTPEEVYDRFVESQIPGFDFVTVDMLSHEYGINLTEINYANAVIERLTPLDGVETVVDQRKYLEPIFALLNAASFTAVGIAVLMLVAATLLISTTIRLSAVSRRREIGIMRLVGASNRYIKTPFVLEGMVAAFIGAALASVAVLAIVKFFVVDYLGEQFRTTQFVGLGDALIVVPILIGLGVTLAALSASFSINRYLRV